MSSVAVAATSPAPLDGGRVRWSRFAEVMAVGGATFLFFPLSWILRRSFGLEETEYTVSFVAFYLAYVINDPHFAVTYLLFYKDVRRRVLSSDVPRAQRARWVFAGVLVPIALIAWGGAALALHSAPALGWMVQLMYLLVGWHYVKQGFGVLAVLSARRGIKVTARERLVVLFHCYAGWAFAWANPSGPARDYEKGVIYTGVAHPRWLELGAGVLLGVSSLWLVWTVASRWLREGRGLPMGPLVGLLVSIWSWTIFSAVDPLLRYFIPALHSIQYIYFVSLMKRNAARKTEGPPTFGRPVRVVLGVLALSALALGWFLFHGLPTFLDTAFVHHPKVEVNLDPLGGTPFFAVIYVFVNVHHYFMDNVVWRRENPDTRHLVEA